MDQNDTILYLKLCDFLPFKYSWYNTLFRIVGDFKKISICLNVKNKIYACVTNSSVQLLFIKHVLWTPKNIQNGANEQ